MIEKISTAALALSLSLIASPIIAQSTAANEHIITREQWPQAANAHNIAALPAVRTVLRAFDESGRFGVRIRHPGDDGGRKWASAMRAWLISLGVASKWIESQIGSGGDQLIVSVIARR